MINNPPKFWLIIFNFLRFDVIKGRSSVHNAMGCQMSRQKAFEGELFNVLKIALRGLVSNFLKRVLSNT